MTKKRREPLTPDLTALIDVVFILLIFFIVSSVFKKEELALQLVLPTSDASQLEVEIKQINIELSTTKIAFGGVNVDLKSLEKSLSKITKKDKPVIVRIDKDVPYESVIKILNLLQKYSLNNLALVTATAKKSN
ncbi:MAG: biopolymer transporter ExbD [Arcobacteraceae bacterium]|nr:biopolymer transporter ExbD [Arcobacteraceae bacterium]